MPRDIPNLPPPSPPIALADLALINGFDPEAMTPRMRFNPITRAIWTALLVPVGDLARWHAESLRSATSQKRPGASISARIQTLDVAAAALVLRAVSGDLAVTKLIADRIEGKAARRIEEC